MKKKVVIIFSALTLLVGDIVFWFVVTSFLFPKSEDLPTVEESETTYRLENLGLQAQWGTAVARITQSDDGGATIVGPHRVRHGPPEMKIRALSNEPKMSGCKTTGETARGDLFHYTAGLNRTPRADDGATLRGFLTVDDRHYHIECNDFAYKSSFPMSGRWCLPLVAILRPLAEMDATPKCEFRPESPLFDPHLSEGTVSPADGPCSVSHAGKQELYDEAYADQLNDEPRGCDDYVSPPT